MSESTSNNNVSTGNYKFIFLFQIPTTEEGWKRIANDYGKLWNFPHCVGSIDGKHIMIQSPINSGSEFYNYKKFFSIVLMAIVDANYCFTFIDCGCQGRLSDGEVFRNTQLYEKIEMGQLNLPPDESLDGTNQSVPYLFVGDDAFGLSATILKPFSGTYPKGSMQRIFNYRLSRARRIVENVFGISSVAEVITTE